MKDRVKIFDNNIYSLDMLRVNFRIKLDDIQCFLNSLKHDIRYTYWESYTVGGYRHNFKVECENLHTFWIGLCVNSEKNTLKNRTCTIEFNPTKVSEELTFISNYNKFVSLSVSPPAVKRFDLAIDIPVDRDKCYLVKDKRTYQEYRNSSLDLTQYLGQRSSGGFVKLYNKSKELGLSDYGLTRLELTMDWEYKDFAEAFFPKVYVFDDFQLDFNITGTDKVLLIACLHDMTLLNELPRKKKEKIREILQNSTLTLPFNEHDYKSILAQICEYTST